VSSSIAAQLPAAFRDLRSGSQRFLPFLQKTKRVVRTPCSLGWDRRFVFLTGPHTLTAVSVDTPVAAKLEVPSSYVHRRNGKAFPSSGQKRNAVKASVPKLLQLSRYYRLPPSRGSLGHRLAATSETYSTVGLSVTSGL
jgi:hypothetical protein